MGFTANSKKERKHKTKEEKSFYFFQRCFDFNCFKIRRKKLKKAVECFTLIIQKWIWIYISRSLKLNSKIVTFKIEKEWVNKK